MDRMTQVAVSYVERYPGSTAKELDHQYAEDTGSNYNDGPIRKRLNDAAHLGLLRRGEKRRCRITGKESLTWHLAGAPEETSPLGF